MLMIVSRTGAKEAPIGGRALTQLSKKHADLGLLHDCGAAGVSAFVFCDVARHLIMSAVSDPGLRKK
jgi:hypothetical protein